MKESFNLFRLKVKASLIAHFDKNPNDLIALSFGIFVLAFILFITPQIPQKSTATFAEQSRVDQDSIQQVDPEMDTYETADENKVVLKATLK